MHSNLRGAVATELLAKKHRKARAQAIPWHTRGGEMTAYILPHQNYWGEDATFYYFNLFF